MVEQNVLYSYSTESECAARTAYALCYLLGEIFRPNSGFSCFFSSIHGSANSSLPIELQYYYILHEITFELMRFFYSSSMNDDDP